MRGGQANLWTGHIRTPQAAEYMLWPRALAMSEVLWSARERRDWDGFAARLGPQLAALGRMNVNYRVPEVLGLDGDVLTLAPTATLGNCLPRCIFTCSSLARVLRSVSATSSRLASASSVGRK